MVDSGSDVVTLREEVLDSLDLELIGPINSKGVHASRTKNLYRANMIIGNQSLEIEVMGESYDSIGSRVIRHFRHYITGNRHIWLKGDYVDPTMPSSQQSHVGESQPISSEALPTTISQDKSSDQSEISSLETPPVPSVDKSGVEPEEQELYLGAEQTTEEGMDVTEPAKVQKDSGVINGHVKQVPKPPEANVETIEFSFKTNEDDGINDEEKSDETDLLLVKDDDIIDVRPFIEANRAKHAKFFQGQPDRHLDTKIRIDNRVLANGIDESSFSIIESGVNAAHVPKLQENLEETFLSQRSVYYRSTTIGKHT